MNHSAHPAALELLLDANCESCLPLRRHAGWKRDQYLRRRAAEPLAFGAALTEVRDSATPSLSAAHGFTT